MLRVWPGQAALDEQLAVELTSGHAASGDTTWDALWSRHAEDPVAARLALRAACGGAGAGLTRGYLSSVARFVAEAQRAGLSADDLLRASADEGERVRRLAEIFAELPAARRTPVPVVGDVEILPRLLWEPGDVERVVALARRATGRVTVHLAWGAGPAYAAMDPVLAAFEARAELTNLELVLDEPARGCVPLGLAAPTPEAELRAVAAHARHLVDEEGAAPEEIAVATRAPDAGAQRLGEELARVGLRLDDRRGPPLASAPPVRLALALLELPGRGFPREETLAALGSRYLGDALTPELRRARTMGVRRLAPTLDARLARLARLPETASIAAHAAALSALLVDLGVADRARQLDVAAGPRVEAAIARDQAAMFELERLLARLASFDTVLPRAEFAAVLADLAAEVPISPRGARGGAVRLVHLADLGARRFEHLVLIGLVDSVATEDGVYGESERRAFNRGLGRRALPTGDLAATDRFLLEHALGTGRRSVLLTWPTVVADRAATRAPFVDEVLRAPPAVLPRSPVPHLGQAWAPADLLARVALEAWADPAGRMPPSPQLAAGGLVEALRVAQPERVARVEALAALERERFLGDSPAVPGVDARVGGTAETPLSAKTIEMLANCAWSFFAGRVLGVGMIEEGTDAPSPRHAGLLAHRCLEAFYRERQTAGRLPLRADDDDRRALAEACARAAAEEREAPGHAELWALAREKLVETLWRWVRHEAAQGTPGGGVPSRFELSFGYPGGLPALQVGGVHIGGRIDRVDVTPDGGAVVIDYKLGAAAGQRTKLRAEEVASHQLQLPLYTLAARAALGVRVDAAFISLRDAAPTKSLREVLGDDADRLLDEVVPARIAALAANARAGEFPVRPLDCRNCPYRTVCRVVALVEEED